MADVYLCNDAPALAARACNWLLAKIQQHQSNSSQPFALALAGGSTPRALYQLMSEVHNKFRIDWTSVVFLWGDERNVPPDHADSNYRMASDCLIKSLPVSPRNILPVPEPGGDAGLAAIQYEKLLRSRLPLNSGGVGIIDCVLLGMGDDVHTASLFPETAALSESKSWVVANYVPKLDAWRVTMTAPLINAAKQVVFLISGAGKTQALRTLWNGPPVPHLYPAQMIQPISGYLSFFVDQAALGDIVLPSELGTIQ